MVVTGRGRSLRNGARPHFNVNLEVRVTCPSVLPPVRPSYRPTDHLSNHFIVYLSLFVWQKVVEN